MFSRLLDTPGWVTTFTTAINNVLNPILILVATAGIIYAINPQGMKQNKN